MWEEFGCPRVPSVSPGAYASAAGLCARKPFGLNREGARGKLRHRDMGSLVRKRLRCSPGGEGWAGTCRGHTLSAARPSRTQPCRHPRPQPAACPLPLFWGKTGRVGGRAAHPPSVWQLDPMAGPGPSRCPSSAVPTPLPRPPPGSCPQPCPWTSPGAGMCRCPRLCPLPLSSLPGLRPVLQPCDANTPIGTDPCPVPQGPVGASKWRQMSGQSCATALPATFPLAGSLETVLSRGTGGKRNAGAVAPSPGASGSRSRVPGLVARLGMSLPRGGPCAASPSPRWERGARRVLPRATR